MHELRPQHGGESAADVSVRATLSLLTFLASFQSFSEDRGLFTDPEDGALDASEWLLDRSGFLPVPIIITEPAIGYGGGAAVLFFRESIRQHSVGRDRLSPPDI